MCGGYNGSLEKFMPQGISGFGIKKKEFIKRGFSCSLIVNFHKFIVEFFQKKIEQ